MRLTTTIVAFLVAVCVATVPRAVLAEESGWFRKEHPIAQLDEGSPIGFCRDFSHIARDVMAARHENKPMSEALPFAITLVEAWVKKYGVEMDSQQIEETAAAFARDAYESRLFPDDSLWNEDRRKAISEFENEVFEMCYTEFKRE